ncbi:MAG: type I-C CRISPR-associated protein Cas8c/Csd1 [Rhodocyclaceae bacterium]|nr:type I-C CRISPR-associated protein Cas8c/Csd1 [Rhodocyclaceae bacterium]
MRLPNIGKQATRHNNSGKDANLLWDNASFAFGLGKNGNQKLACFIETIEHWVGGIEDRALLALLTFLRRFRDDFEYRNDTLSHWADSEVLATGQPVVAFRYVDDDTSLICQRQAVREAFQIAFEAPQAAPTGACLISGKTGVPIQLSHPVIKGVWKAQVSGASIVSFNARAYESYGKAERQGENAPVSIQAASAYTKALNHLLKSRQHLLVGDTSTIFWAQQHTSFEDVFAQVFGGGDNPDEGAEEVRALYRSIKNGQFSSTHNNSFYTLGLVSNEARISIRFWHVAPLSEIALRVTDWFDDLSLARGQDDPEFPPLYRAFPPGSSLLTACAAQGKADNIPPRLSGDIMRAIIFNGTTFPATVQRRCSTLPRRTTRHLLARSRDQGLPQSPDSKSRFPQSDFREGVFKDARSRQH